MIEALSRSTFSAAIPAAGIAAQAPVATTGNDFTAVLGGFATSTVDVLRQGETAAAQGIMGTLPAQQVVESVMAAERGLQTALAVRDKLVGAYLEISRMQI